MKSALISFTVIFGIAATAVCQLPTSSRLISEVPPPIQADEQQLKRLGKAMAGENLDTLLTAVLTVFPNGCPTIYSSWYCDRLAAKDSKADKEQASHERRLRMFGSDLLKRLDRECSNLVLDDAKTEQCKSAARQLVSFSDWLAKGDGYGNGILAARCRMVACVAVSHLVIDITFPIDNAKQFVDSLESGVGGQMEWMRWVVRAHEREVPGALAPFVAKGETVDGVRKSFGQAAVRGSKLLNEHLTKDDQSTVGIDLEATRRVRLSLPEQVAVFLDDPLRGSSTLEQWERYRLFPEYHSKFVQHLRVAVIFREKIGGFPLGPLPVDVMRNGQLNPKYISEIHAAFANAWSDFCNKKEFLNSDLKKDPTTGRMVVDPNAENLSVKYANLSPGSITALIYQAVKSGRFNDYLLDDTPKH
jgi:hypothetical protein